MRSKIGWVLSILIAGLLLFSAFFKFNPTPEMIEMSEKNGLPGHLFLPLGITESAVAILSLIPQTAFFGVILITGYMGGAICQHLRLGEPIFIQTLVPIIAWIGFGLRNFDGTMRLVKNQG